jgi:predicted PurR-regulated permease PerM
MRPVLAFLVTAGGVAVVLAGLVWLTYVALADFVLALPHYQQPLRLLAADVWHAGAAVNLDLQALTSLPPPDPAPLLTSITEAIRSLLSGLTGGWALVLLATVFMLFEARTAPDKLRRALRDDHPALARMRRFVDDLGRYMGVLTLTNVLVGILNGLLLLALGVPGALLWAALSALLGYIPDVGFIVSVIPPTVATLLHAGPAWALVVLAAFIVINTLVDEVLYPRLVGTQLDIAPFWTLVSLVFWGWLLGPAGAVLAVPLTMLLKLVLDSFDETSVIAGFLSNGAPRRRR